MDQKPWTSTTGLWAMIDDIGRLDKVIRNYIFFKSHRSKNEDVKEIIKNYDKKTISSAFKSPGNWKLRYYESDNNILEYRNIVEEDILLEIELTEFGKIKSFLLDCD